MAVVTVGGHIAEQVRHCISKSDPPAHEQWAGVGWGGVGWGGTTLPSTEFELVTPPPHHDP